MAVRGCLAARHLWRVWRPHVRCVCCTLHLSPVSATERPALPSQAVLCVCVCVCKCSHKPVGCCGRCVFGVVGLAQPGMAFHGFGFPEPKQDRKLVLAFIRLFAVRNLYLGASLLLTVWLGASKLLSGLLLGFAGIALVDGAVSKALIGTREWQHWQAPCLALHEAALAALRHCTAAVAQALRSGWRGAWHPVARHPRLRESKRLMTRLTAMCRGKVLLRSDSIFRALLEKSCLFMWRVTYSRSRSRSGLNSCTDV